MLEALPEDHWQTITWREHGEGSLRKQFVVVQPALGDGWYCNNLPADTPLQRLVEPVHSRWPIEQFYEDAKGECGLDDYQGRHWDGRHRHLARHLALVMLAYSFLVRQRWTPAVSAGFSPAGECPSFPAGHRQVLVWLFQDVQLWLITTNQIAHFRSGLI